MRILVVSTLMPTPPDRGDRIREYEMLRELSTFGSVLLALVGAAEALDEVPMRALDEMGVHLQTFPLYAWEKFVGILGAILKRRPWGVWRISRVAQKVMDLEGPWDVVVAFQLRSAYFAEKVAARHRILELTDSLGLYRKKLPALRNPLRWLALTGAAHEEAHWAERFPVTLLSAKDDAAAISRLCPGARMRVVENGADHWESPVVAGTKDAVIFVGSLFYPPNIDGVKWFLRRIWPGLAVKYPNLSFRIIGERPSEVGSWSGPRVTWVGHVPDLAQEYERALALVNPVRYGTGTRRKVLCAWGAGVPVISTPEGARGLQFVEDEHLILARNQSEFHEAIAHLMSPATWQYLSRSGWEHARTRYAARELWHSALEELLGEIT